jgi:hypothetical protein
VLRAGAFALAVAGSPVGEAHAQGKLDARYTVTLGGIPFGKGAWLIDVRDDQFSASASGATSGILRVFASGQGKSAVRGIVSHGLPMGSSFASSVTTDSKHDDVRIVMSGNTVKDYGVEPPTAPSRERVPLTEAHRRNVSDPMTAALLRVPGNGETFAPEACNRKLAIFDGRMRYDLQLAFKRLDKVKSEKGYQGTVAVCSVAFVPVAGYVPSRSVIKYLVATRDIEVWLAPIAGTRIMVPYRVSLPTPLGMGILEATQFVSVPNPSVRASSGVRSQ